MINLRLKAAVIMIALCFLVAAALYPELWRYAGVPALPFSFGDLIPILAAGQAWAGGLDVYQVIPLDPLQRPHVYGPWWLWIGSLGLTVNDIQWLGWSICTAFLITSMIVLPVRSKAMAAFSLLIILSPPVLFCIERGNNDLVIFILLATSAWLLDRKKKGCQLAAAAVIITASALKIYPVATCIACVARPNNWQRKLLVLVTVGAACGLVFLWWIDDYIKTVTVMPAPQTLHGYGLKVIIFNGQAFLQHCNWPILILGIGAVGAGLYITVRSGWLSNFRTLWNAIPTTGFHALCFITGSSAWIFCFFLNSNYSYRAVLLLLPLGFWMAQLSEHSSLRLRKASLVQLGLWIAVLWASAPKLMLTTWLRIEPNIWAKALLTILSAFEQTFSLLLTVIMAVCVTGWTFRSFNSHVPDYEPMQAVPLKTDESVG